jgi:RNA polymerase sigma-70 factor (ECF subfamily)
MVLLQGVPQHVVAEVMNCSPGTVAWRVHEARRRLRRKLRGEIPPSFFQRSEVRA